MFYEEKLLSWNIKLISWENLTFWIREERKRSVWECIECCKNILSRTSLLVLKPGAPSPVDPYCLLLWLSSLNNTRSRSSSEETIPGLGCDGYCRLSWRRGADDYNSEIIKAKLLNMLFHSLLIIFTKQKITFNLIKCLGEALLINIPANYQIRISVK